MSLLVGFIIFLMVLFIIYSVCRLLLRKTILNLLTLCLQLFAVSIAVISFKNDVEAIEVLQGVYILCGIIIPGLFLIYDYVLMKKRIRKNGVVNGLIERKEKSDKYESDMIKHHINGISSEIEIKVIEKNLEIDKEEITKNIKNITDQAHVHINQKDYEEAFKDYEFILKLVKTSPCIYFNFANLCYHLGEYSKAEENYKKAIKLSKKQDKGENSLLDEHRVYYNMGNTQYMMEKFDSALKSYEKALSLKPDFEEALENIPAALVSNGKSQEAVRYYNYIINKVRDKSRVHFLLGRVYLQMEQYEKSVEEFTKFLELKPGHPQAYMELGKLYSRMDRFTESAEIFEKYIKARPFDGNGYYYKAISLYHLGMIDEAVKTYKLLLQIEPQNYTGYYNLGVCFDETGRCEEAVKCFEKVIDIKPDFSIAYNNLGIILSTQGKHKEAVDVFIKGLKKHPGEHSLYYNLGITLAEMGRYTEAVESYKNAMEIKPDEYEISYHMGNALIQLGKYDEAVKVFKEALKFKPSESELFYNLASVYSILKKHDIAINNLRKAIELNIRYKKEARFDRSFDSIRTSSEFRQLVS